MIQIQVVTHPLIFKKPSGTSRGILTEKPTWFIKAITENGVEGIGECSLIPGLSIDEPEAIEALLENWRTNGFANLREMKMAQEACSHLPALAFALETAIIGIEQADTHRLFNSKFTQGTDAISINGLIWMGSKADMFQQVQTKIEAGFTCIKLKIGALDFETELDLLKHIRTHFSPADIELRVDANGAFSPETALEKLKQLAEFELHSIEQPIKPNQPDAHAMLCEKSPLAIALDEELIGLKSDEERITCLQQIKPQYIILKPSLIGGLNNAKRWISIAQKQTIGYWITSALESNIGLNAIAQFTYTLNSTLPQGLGTGQLFTNNIASPLEIKNGHLHYNPKLAWQTV